MDSAVSALNHTIPVLSNPVVPIPKDAINLNQILQQALQPYSTSIRNADIIFRCEVLPEMEGNKLEIGEVFNKLISIIVENPPVGSRLFLHINCEEQDKEILDLSLSSGCRSFLIQFHTNISTSANWKLIHQPLFERCTSILLAHKATLTVNDVLKNGCLFSISLSGKL